jgi:uncharacterized protein DUF4390
MKASLPALTFWLITGLTAGPALGGPALTQLSAERDGDSYKASCRLDGALTPEVEEEIASGLATTIEYHLNVYRRRPAFFDQALVKHRVECTVRYDTMTQQYTLTRRVDDELQETQVTDDPAVMRRFMTSLKSVPLLKSEVLKPGEEYYLKAKSSLGLIWRFYLIPWSMDTEWKRVPIGPSGGGKDFATRP